MSKKYNYSVYKAQNEHTGEVYIGATTNSVHQRKLDHTERALRGEKGKFQQAIGTYGPEAFTWRQIDTANSIDELARKEKEYIIKYDSKESGYNSDSGGGIKKTVYQYDLKDGGLVNTFDCLESAANAVNAIKQQLSRACLSVNNTFKGFYWSYEYIDPFQPKLDNRKKAIVQIDVEGNKIAFFNSIAKASSITGCNKASIAKVCRGERNLAGGFIWKYE